MREIKNSIVTVLIFSILMSCLVVFASEESQIIDYLPMTSEEDGEAFEMPVFPSSSAVSFGEEGLSFKGNILDLKYKQALPRDYIFSSTVCTSYANNVFIYFNYKDDRNTYCIKITKNENCSLYKLTDGVKKILAEFGAKAAFTTDVTVKSGIKEGERRITAELGILSNNQIMSYTAELLIKSPLTAEQ